MHNVRLGRELRGIGSSQVGREAPGGLLGVPVLHVVLVLRGIQADPHGPDVADRVVALVRAALGPARRRRLARVIDYTGRS